MKTNVVIYTILISVICILLILLHQLRSNHQKLLGTRKPDKLFLDLIPNQPTIWPRSRVKQCSRSTIDQPTRIQKAYNVSKNENILLSDDIYFNALIVPAETAYNVKPTAYLVDHMDVLMFKQIDDKNAALKSEYNLSANFEAFKRTFYLHVYHTIAIEGNTMSASQLQYILETGQTIGSKSITEHNEVLGVELALRYVKLLSVKKYVELDDILMIHKRLMGYVDPVMSGVYRTEQVFIGNHIPPAPDLLDHLMQEFVDWLNSGDASIMHPVKLAALAHFKFVDIHPFIDGNGRTSRLIMNLILLKAGFPPIIINKEYRNKYYECLNVANAGDVRPFVQFIAYCADETLNTYLGLNKQLKQWEKEIENVIEIDGFNKSLVINYS